MLKEENRVYGMMRLWTVIGLTVAACLVGPFALRCGAQVTLVWNPSTSACVTGYNLCWGTNSGNYLYTNGYTGAETNATISDLATNEVFFFAVQAVSTNGLVSAFSNEEAYTNGTPSILPPSPPGGGSSPSGSPTNTGSQTAGGKANSTSSTNLTQSTFWGVPPFLSLTVSNGAANLNIGATVGATLTVLCATNDLSLDAWSGVTNVTVSNIAPIAQTNQTGQPQDMLDLAFVPGTQTVPVPASNSPGFQYFRVVMPSDYVILAYQVLPGKGYTPRLILVNMPGIVCDDACYVNEAGSFIHYTRTNYALQLISSGSTIRQIASTLAGSLNLDWTSASEFTYSNGLGQILATVIETEPPSSDPAAGQKRRVPPILIDF